MSINALYEKSTYFYDWVIIFELYLIIIIETFFDLLRELFSTG